MLKWEEEQRKKVHRQKITQAKPIVPKSNVKKSMKAQNESSLSYTSSISGFSKQERDDKDAIPLYKLLKMYNLQQYAQQLISRGYGYDLVKFSLLTETQLNLLASEIKVLPGHKSKLSSLVMYINKLIYSERQQETTSLYTSGQKQMGKSQQQSRKPMAVKSSQSTRNKFHNVPTQGTRSKQMKLTNIGYDFFQEESDMEDEFNQALNTIMQKYQNEPYVIEKPMTQQSNITNMTTRRALVPMVAQDDIVLVSKFNAKDVVETQLQQNRLITNLGRVTMKKKKRISLEEEDEGAIDLQMSQIKHMYLSYESGKLTSTLVNLDIEEMSNCLGWAISKHIQFQRKTNHSVMRNSSIPLSMEYKFKNTGFNNNQIDNSQNPIEEPTQLNLNDDQQMGLFQSQQINKIDRPQLHNNNRNNHTLGQISEQALDNTAKHNEFDSNKRQIEDILKESLLMKQRMQIDDDDDNGDCYLADHLYDVCSDEEIEEKQELQESCSPIRPIYAVPQQQQLVKMNNISKDSLQYVEDSQPVYNYSMSQQPQEQSMFQSKFDFIELDDESEKEKRNLYMKTYVDPNYEQVMPSVDVISNYCKNIVITSKMEKEVTIVALIYVEKLLIQAGLSLEPSTWRRVVFISLILASKIWDDESFENDNFAKVFTQFRTQDINEMERVFLILIDYRLYIKQEEYAKYYFILRTYAEAKKKSFPLKPLDLHTIMKLQKHTQLAEYGLKQKYQQTMNRSF